MADADLFIKAGEKIVVLRTRQYAIYPFSAVGWTDLRVGFFLSITKKETPPGPPTPPIDDVTVLAETIGADDVTVLPARDRYWIGVKTATEAMPGDRGVIFAGFTNIRSGGMGRSVLSGSDNGTGTGSAYWWPHNALEPGASAIILQEANRFVPSPAGLTQHFPGPGAVAAGYAGMLGLRFTRPNAQSMLWTMEIKTDGVNADMLYTNTPTEELLISNLQAWPAAIQMGPLELANFVPAALYCYWPFTLSRLRIHATAVYRASP